MSSFFPHDLFTVYGELLTPFRNKAFGPELATLLLITALLVLIGFLCLTLPQAIRLRAALATIKNATQGEREADRCLGFSTNYEAIDRALSSNKTTRTAWLEFRKCLMRRGTPERPIFFNSVPSGAFFNPKNLRVQYEFARTLPNLFVGLGLLGTFIGLIAALTFATQGLTNATNQEQIKDALKLLLTTAAAKFYISASGLVASLILSISFKYVLKHLRGLVQKINNAFESCILYFSPQAVADAQLAVQRDSLEEFKTFNTNVALKIGDAVRVAVESGNEVVTNRLSAIAELVFKATRFVQRRRWERSKCGDEGRAGSNASRGFYGHRFGRKCASRRSNTTVIGCGDHRKCRQCGSRPTRAARQEYPSCD